ncbi:MAG: sensor histidine kinase [Nocardiopsaceae bacterium]|nr:sensor histidine kinase [Nocardiopsaceae bacterium]
MTTRSASAGQPRAARGWTADAIVAAVVAAVQAGSAYVGSWHHHVAPAAPGAVALLAFGGAVLVLRRRLPVITLGATYVIVFVLTVTGQAGSPWLGSTVAFCTAIFQGKRVAAVAFLTACYVTALWGPLLAGQPGPSVVFAESLGAGLAFLLGAAELIRLWRQRAAAIEQRREEEILRRASEERLRIARDLHDVVAHNISVINVQASTALHLMDRQPERARSALETINQVSKQALAEVRSTLGVLRAVDERAPREPSATLARLGDLVRNAEAAGLTVDIENEGEDLPLPAGVSLAAYRIIQEALTNSARHSGGTRAVVRISRSRGERELIIDVDDDGPGGSAPRVSGGTGPGNGITGMTERAHALGGTLTAGPRAGGGFRVRALLPLAEDAS